MEAAGTLADSDFTGLAFEALADADRRKPFPESAGIIKAIQGIDQGTVAGTSGVFLLCIPGQVLNPAGHFKFTASLAVFI